MSLEHATYNSLVIFVFDHPNQSRFVKDKTHADLNIRAIVLVGVTGGLFYEYERGCVCCEVRVFWNSR